MYCAFSSQKTARALLKWRVGFKRHALARVGVGEGERTGVQHQAIHHGACLLMGVELTPQDGVADVG